MIEIIFALVVGLVFGFAAGFHFAYKNMEIEVEKLRRRLMQYEIIS